MRIHVCALGPVCVCACVPIFPPCGQVTIANQDCKPCLKRPSEEERRERELGREGANEWVLSFVLITEAEIKMNEGMDGWRWEDRNSGINRVWVFAPALQWAFNCPPWLDTVQTSIFLCLPFICFALHKSELLVFIKCLSITYSFSFFLHSLLYLLRLAPTRFLSAIFPRGNDEYLRADRSATPNPFCSEQNVPHGVHMCYGSSNFLIEMETQFITFLPLCPCKWDFLHGCAYVLEALRMDSTLDQQEKCQYI